MVLNAVTMDLPERRYTVVTVEYGWYAGCWPVADNNRDNSRLDGVPSSMQ